MFARSLSMRFGVPALFSKSCALRRIRARAAFANTSPFAAGAVPGPLSITTETSWNRTIIARGADGLDRATRFIPDSAVRALYRKSDI